MPMLTDNILNLIGNTPLIRLKQEPIFAKAEFFNPGGSIKDRVALSMIEGAEAKGVLKPGMLIVEPTSGNTGIGIALVGRMKGYDVHIVMPENMSEERKRLIRALGAQLTLTPAEKALPAPWKRLWKFRLLMQMCSCRSSLRIQITPASITKKRRGNSGGRWKATLPVSWQVSAAAAHSRASVSSSKNTSQA